MKGTRGSSADLPDTEARRPDPELLLRQVEAEERDERRGRLKVFLGYASGVGKSFRMLDEARRRRERGQDVVVGALQEVLAPEVEALLGPLEVIPPRMVQGTPVMDLGAILRRHPESCVVDGLAYDNPPGSANPWRWRDVEQMLGAGISVIGSVNIQYIDELRDQVEKLTGKHVTQTIPRSLLSSADEIVLVDAPPDLAQAEEGGDEGEGLFRQQRLSALREIALVLAADVVDKQLEAYLERHGIANMWGTQERILVCLTPRAKAASMIDAGRRNADRFHGELFACYVEQPELAPEDRASLDVNLALARKAMANLEILDGDDPIAEIMRLSRERGITQIFIGHSLRESWWDRIFGGPVDRFIRAAEGIDVRVFPH